MKTHKSHEQKERHTFLSHLSMQRATVFTLSVIFILLSGLPLTGVAQQSTSPGITIHASKKPLINVLNQLAKQYGYAIYYNADQLQNIQITATINHPDIKQALDKLLLPTHLGYHLNGNTITIFPHPPTQVSTEPLIGRVTDTSGEPLPGVNIQISDTNLRAITDTEGLFHFAKAVPYGSLLHFSYIGMQTQQIVYTGEIQLNICLKEISNQLETVIVTGFQTISRERSTGAAHIINSKDLERIQTPNLGSKLEGLTPGLTHYRGGMRIRGISSFSIESTPLLVLDGQAVTGIGINDLNPSDIESVTILKDAAATSLYGIRASNGVIVVTTKKGSTRKPDIRISANFFINPLPSFKYQRLASTSDIIDYEQEYLLNDPSYRQDPLAYFANRNSLDGPQYMSKVSRLYYELAQGNITERQLTNELNALRNNDYRQELRKALQRMSIKQDYNLSVTQGTDASNTFFSARYEENGSYYKHDQNNRYTLNLNNDFKLTQWLKLGIGNMLTFSHNESYGAPFQSPTSAMPYDKLYNTDGTLAYLYPFNYYVSQQIATRNGFQHMGYNAIEEARHNRLKDRNLYWKFSVHTDVLLAKELTWTVKMQYENRWQNSERNNESSSYFMRRRVNEYASTNPDGGYTYHIPQGGHMSESHSQWSNINFRTQIDYKKTFIDKHDITLLAGGEIREDKFRNSQNERYGYDEQKLTYQQVDWKTLNQKGVIGQLSHSKKTLGELLAIGDTRHRYVSTYFNAGYTYNSLYTLNISARMDQADLFGTDPQYRYRPLWSIGASWNISNETFMKDVKWVDILKLRTTYGITGNVDQSSSPYLLGTYITSPYSGANLTSILTPPNPTLRWEKTSTWNIGGDFVFLRKLSGSIDFYSRNSSDLLANKSLDPSIGFETARINNGALNNIGLELSVSYEWLKNRNWQLNTTLTVAYNRNKITEVGYQPTDAIAMITNPRNNYLKNDALNTLYAYQYAGLSTDGNPSVYDAEGNIISNQPVRDIRSVVKMGILDPQWNGAFDIGLSWKSLSLYAKFVYYAGHNLRTDETPLYAGILSAGSDIHEDIAKRWKPGNTNTNIPSMGLYGLQDERNYHWKYADAHVASAAFIKLRNITLSYSLPQQWMQVIGCKSIQLRAQISNPLYWAANNKGIDPEAYNANMGIRETEQVTSYLLGINVNF